MSPDRTTITRAEALRRKKAEKQHQVEEVQRPTRTSHADPRETVSKLVTNVTQTVKPRRAATTARPAPQQRVRKPARPAINLPKINLPTVDFSSITVALIIAALTLGLAYVALYTTVFAVQKVDISGTKFSDPYQIINGLDVMDQPLLTLDRKQIRLNILASYPEVKDAIVKPEFPNKLNVQIIERVPIAEWHQDGEVVWIDSDGYSFQPTTQNASLPIVDALSPAPIPGEIEGQDLIGARPYIFPQLASAIQTVARMLPEGTTITYTAEDGLSWIDPLGGWQVLYGKTDGNNDEKMAVYNTLVDDLTQKGIVPTVISVEYPSNPSYKLSEEE